MVSLGPTSTFSKRCHWYTGQCRLRTQLRPRSDSSGARGQSGTNYDNCSPVLPEAAVVVSTGSAMPPVQTFAPGSEDVAVAHFKVREITSRNGVRINSLRLNAAGSGNDAEAVTAVKLYRDDNADGIEKRAFEALVAPDRRAWRAPARAARR
mgnify:CR=1 FL=1